MVNQVKRTLQIHLTYKIYQQKKIHVDDIEIGYKILGKGDPILFISGDMNDWEASTLGNLSSNHIFETRGVGNTTIGSKPYTIQQLANDTAGLLDGLKIKKQMFLDHM
jgi:hypothetical protein